MKDYLVLIIDSSSIHAILAGKTLLQKQFPTYEKNSSAHMEHALFTTLASVLKEVTKKSNSVEKIHIVLSSPWIVSKTKTSHFTYARPLMIDAEYLDRVIQDERDAFKKIFSFDIEFVEQKVFETKINGKNTRLTKPIPSMSLSISSAMSAMSKHIVKKLINTIDQSFHEVKIAFHSSAILTYISVQNLEPRIESGVFVHIHGECTDITIFKHGSPTHFASINFGSRSLIQSIAKALHVSDGVAESKLSVFEENNFTAHAEGKISPLIEEKLDVWQKEVEELIIQLDSKIPKDIIIHSNQYHALFSNTLENAYENSIITNIPGKMNDVYLSALELVEFHK